MVSAEPSTSGIEEFLNHLFTVKNLKPATIAGYRTAIADHLGPFGQEVGESLHLNRLLASFYRDKPILISYGSETSQSESSPKSR